MRKYRYLVLPQCYEAIYSFYYHVALKYRHTYSEEQMLQIDLVHRNGYLDDKQYQSIYDDAEELVKILVTRCKKINDESDGK